MLKLCSWNSKLIYSLVSPPELTLPKLVRNGRPGPLALNSMMVNYSKQNAREMADFEQKKFFSTWRCILLKK